MVIYSVIHKRVFTPLRDLPTRIIEAIDHSSNSTMAFAFTKNPSKCHCWVWRMVDSLYYSSQKIPKRCENSFVNYRIYYQKLCYSLRRIWTKPVYIKTKKVFKKMRELCWCGRCNQKDKWGKSNIPFASYVIFSNHIVEKWPTFCMIFYNFIPVTQVPEMFRTQQMTQEVRYSNW